MSKNFVSRKNQKKLVIANWKMNPSSLKAAVNLLKNAVKYIGTPKKADVVFCPPFVWLEKMSRLLKNHKGYFLGAQDSFWENSSADRGAFTGEVSFSMLKDVSVDYVILGHSERRIILGESNEMINKKVKGALGAGLKVVLCVGEWSREDANYVDFIIEQVKSATDGLSAKDINNLIIAYEPVWAIGSGTPDTPDDAMSAAMLVRKTLSNRFQKKHGLSVKVLYGGSVNKDNAEQFLKLDQINGILVGRSSLNPVDFSQIVKNL